MLNVIFDRYMRPFLFRLRENIVWKRQKEKRDEIEEKEEEEAKEKEEEKLVLETFHSHGKTICREPSTVAMDAVKTEAFRSILDEI